MAFNTDPTSAKDDAPTNVKFQETSSVTNGHFISVIVMADDSLSTSMTIGSELSNEATTKGFRIKSESTLTFNNFDTVDYFVLIHSDDDKKHHFAKVTNLIVEDDGNGTSTCDAFEFEPKLGSEIPKGTKYRIITGINDTNNKIVALSVGLKQEASSADLKDNLVCARPLFYFFNDRLDKKNQLDHNTKYYALGKTGSSTTVTIAQHASDGITFRTVSDFGKRIVDYSKYSLVVNMTDKLRTLDIGGGGNTTSNEGGTVSLDYNVYKDAYINARRSSDNSITTRDTLGQTRYLHYNYSPEKSNLITAVIDNETRDSINQGSFSESRIVDNGRIMNKKIDVFDPYKVRNLLHRANLDAFVDLKASFVSEASANTFNIRTEYDLGTVLNVGDEVKIQDKIMLVASIGSFTNSATLQSLTVRAEKRTENGNVFSSLSFTPTADDILSRRAYNPTDNTIITTMNLINRTDNLEILFNSTNENKLLATISAVDKDKSMMTVSYTGDSYYANPLEFIRGEYTVYSLKFKGEVEQINTVKEESQTFLDIKGRDKLNKLLSPIINKDTAFSEDIIYSSFSPYNKLTTTYAGNGSSAPNEVEVFDNLIQFGVSSASFASMPVVGDLLFSANGYIGRVTSVSTYSGSLVQVGITRAITRVAAGETIYKQNEKNYMFTKALGSSHIASVSPTSLVGSAGKGLIFTAGNMNLGLGFNAAEGDSLVGTSSFGSFSLTTGKYADNDESAVGYHINEPSSIANDNAFQCKLKDEIGTNGETEFDTVDTLIDFEIVSTSKKDNITEIELAPYIPLTLGRKIKYEGIDAERMETTYTQAAVLTINQSAGEVIFTTNSLSASVNVGDPLYCDTFAGSATETKGFIGYVLDILKQDASANLYGTGNPATNTSFITVMLDRTETSSGNILDFDIGSIVFLSTRKRSHINTINSAHLWGGKIITIPHHTFSSDGNVSLVPFNMHLGTSDMNKEFGMPIYKSFNSDTKRLGDETFTFRDTSNSNITAGLYSVRKNNFTKNFSSYQFKPNVNTGLTNVIEEGKTDSNRKLPYDMRGITSAYGSNITSQRRMKRDSGILSSIPLNLRGSNTVSAVSLVYEGKDYSFPRLFLYITCDILPHDVNRSSSIFSTLKTINDYKLMLVDNSTKTDSDNVILTDSNFQTLSFTTSQVLSNLKRFNLMRLTECVYDENFNLINPEKSTNEFYGDNPNSFANVFFQRIALTGNSITAINGVSNTITFQNSVTLLGGDEIYTSDNEYIATIASNGTGTSHGTTGTVRTPNFSTTHSNPIRLTNSFSSGIGGRHEIDSIDGTSTSKYHPLKGAIIPKTSKYDYGEFSGDYAYEQNSNSAITMPTDAEVVLPSIYRSKLFTNANYLATLDGSFTVPMQETIKSSNNNSYGGTIGIVLDRYDIEDSHHKLEAGNCTGVLGTNTGGTETSGTAIGNREIINVCALNHFKQFFRTNDASTHDYGTTDFRSPADGAFIGFKLRLFYNTGSSQIGGGVLHRSSGSQIYKTVITPHHPDKTAWLKFVDLTGCYLVEESGTASVSSVDSIIGTKVQPIYVYAQEATNGSNDVELYTEVALTNGKAYRVMQPNPVCFYEESPDNIQLFVPRPEYTKKANSNEMYGKQKENYFFNEGGKEYQTTNEAVLSMYVMLDAHEQTSSTNLITTSSTGVLPLGEHELFYSDGNNSFKSNTSSKNTGTDRHTLIIKDKKKLNGVVSVSETFIVNSLEELKINPTRACIGSTVTIANEAEDLLNELFEEEGLTFDNTTPTYPLFIAPKFIGNSLFSAINYILERKDLSLIINENSFSVKPRDDVIFRTNILVNDDKMVDYETVDSGFDFYNQVIVYGSSHKADRKNLSSIQKIGRKALEEVDSSLITQQDVDERASKLLRIHGTLDKKIRVRVIPTGHEQLRAGDIIQFESKQENVALDNYIVLDVTHPISGFITIEMGKYSKKLEDVFAELLLQSQSNSNTLRALSYNEKSSSVDFLEKVKLKEISLLIRTRTSTGSFHLGFAATLNTNTNTFGFAGGSITLTTLLEEDLL